MTRYTQKELRRLAAIGAAIDVSNIPYDEMINITRGRENLGFSYGVYGCNGAAFHGPDGQMYVVIGRVTNLWLVM